MYKTSVSIIGLQEKVNKLILKKSVLENIIEIIKSRYPIEACGILLGKISGEKAFALKAIEINNILGSTKSFWIDEKEWMDKILKAKKQGLEYLGLFHSHYRDSVIPSMNDMERMIECPEEIWLILSYSPPEKIKYAAWRLDEKGLGLFKIDITIE